MAAHPALASRARIGAVALGVLALATMAALVALVLAASSASTTSAGGAQELFLPEERFAAGEVPVLVAIADLNDDGAPDLVAANLGSRDVSVLLGNGDGTFQAQQRFATSHFPFSVTLADLNGDDAIDLVTTNHFSDDVSVLLGNGDGSFQGPQRFPAGDARSLAVVNLNGDGAPDLVTANCFSDDVAVLLGNGDGTFQAQRRFAAGDCPLDPGSLAAADLNSDGRADLVTANHFSDDVSVLLGNGDGTLQPPQHFAAGDDPRSVLVDDFNADGAPDVVTANAGSNDVSVLLGNGDGTLQGPQPVAAGVGPRSVAVADLNADGAPDVVTANAGSNDVSVLLHRPTVTPCETPNKVPFNGACGTPTPTPTPTPTETPTPTGTPTNTPTPTATLLPGTIKSPALQNLFLTRQGAKIPSVQCVGPQGGNDVAVLTQSLSAPITSLDPKGSGQPQQLGAFEFEVHYNATKVCVELQPGAAAVNMTCFVQDDVTKPVLEGVARIGCVTVGKTGFPDTTTPEGRHLADILVRPQPDVYSQAIPNQGNGVVVQLLNQKCELADLQGHPIALFSCDDADVTIRYLEGDVEPDCVVNTLDTQAIAFRWGATKGSLLYLDRFNLEPFGAQADDDVDIKDLQVVYGRIGSTCAAPHPEQPPVNPKG